MFTHRHADLKHTLRCVYVQGLRLALACFLSIALMGQGLMGLGMSGDSWW